MISNYPKQQGHIDPRTELLNKTRFVDSLVRMGETPDDIWYEVSCLATIAETAFAEHLDRVDAHDKQRTTHFCMVAGGYVRFVYLIEHKRRMYLFKAPKRIDAELARCCREDLEFPEESERLFFIPAIKAFREFLESVQHYGQQ